MIYKRKAYKSLYKFPPKSRLVHFFGYNFSALFHNSVKRYLVGVVNLLDKVFRYRSFYAGIFGILSSFLVGLIKFFLFTFSFVVRIFFKRATFSKLFYIMSVDREFLTPSGMVQTIKDYLYFRKQSWRHRWYRFGKYTNNGRARKSSVRWAAVAFVDQWVPILVQTIEHFGSKKLRPEARQRLISLAWNVLWSEQYLYRLSLLKLSFLRRLKNIYSPIEKFFDELLSFRKVFSFRYNNIERLEGVYRVLEPMVYGTKKRRHKIVVLLSHHYFYSYIAPILYTLRRPSWPVAYGKVDSLMAHIEDRVVLFLGAFANVLFGLYVSLYLVLEFAIGLAGRGILRFSESFVGLLWFLVKPIFRTWLRIFYYLRTFFGHRDSIPFLLFEEAITHVYLRMTQFYGAELEPERTGTDYYRSRVLVRLFFFEFRLPTLKSLRRGKRISAGNPSYEADPFRFAVSTEATLNVFGGEESAEFQQSHVYVWELDFLDEEDEEQQYQTFYGDEDESFWKDMYVFQDAIERTHYEDEWSSFYEKDITEENIGFHRAEGWLVSLFPRKGFFYRLILVPVVALCLSAHAVFMVGLDHIVRFYFSKIWFPVAGCILPPNKGSWRTDLALGRFLIYLRSPNRNIRHKHFHLLGVLVLVGWFFHLFVLGLPLTHNPWYILGWFWVGSFLVAGLNTSREVYRTAEGRVVYEFLDDHGLDQEEGYRDHHDEEPFPEGSFYAHAVGFYLFFHLYVRWLLETDPMFGYILSLRETGETDYLWDRNETYDYESLQMEEVGHDAEAGYDLAPAHLDKNLDHLEEDAASCWSPVLPNPTVYDPFGLARYQRLDEYLYAEYCLVAKKTMSILGTIVDALSFVPDIIGSNLAILVRAFGFEQLRETIRPVLVWLYHILGV